MKSSTFHRPLLPVLLFLLAGGIGCGGNPGAQSNAAPAGLSRGSVLTSAEIEQYGSATSMAQLLALLPGLVVGGGGVQFVGRSAPPLFVIDGVPASDPGAALGMNPRDIARIEAVRDSAELAAYGVRGGNGVILISTK